MPFSLSMSMMGMGDWRTSAISLPAACSVTAVATNLGEEIRLYSAFTPYFLAKASMTGSTAVILA
jgi:hypothetical protein